MWPGPARSTGPRAILAVLLIVLFGLSSAGVAAEPTFPALTGRVVDAAGILQPEERAGLEAKLKAYEDKTSDQVVVATVPSLQGTSIEDFGNRLFRAWQLGQKNANNGALLVVAPNERKVRIEVGYGLEGALTDALSKVIITTAITPRFKAGDFAGGINAGVDAMLSILSGDADEWHRRAKVRGDEADPLQGLVFLVILIVIIFVFWRMSRAQRGAGRRGGGFIIVPGPPSGGWSGGVSGGFGDGGGFSGGGGSSGGGGASGDW
ncbi:TPM domain-containing protein [Methylobacterium planeticum]|uniref:YgcG family protein n=1 Tax=Methylobacterium planeticum TaxID=2615211 RepID=A0A6N6MUZ1_9HYPH|nr:YgcG family protein [Methylobacterium planeticum]KAB1074668.1 YgcG family protein [Methylobacterium planeticum]